LAVNNLIDAYEKLYPKNNYKITANKKNETTTGSEYKPRHLQENLK
jgi:hypothetical protein